MVTVDNFHTVVFDYLSLSIDRKLFTLRFAELLSGIEKYGDAPAIELGHALYSHLVLAIAGAISEEILRARLADEVSTINVLPQFRASESSVVTQNSASQYDYSELTFA